MKYLLAILSIFLFSACSPTIKMVTDPAQVSPKIVMSKGACFGECPVYTLTIYNSGLMKFNGVRYTKMDGKYERQMKEDEYISLIKKIEESDIWSMDATYDMEIADLPSTTISYSDKENIKTIKSKGNKPETLNQLEDYLENLIYNADWIQTEAPAVPEEEEKIDIKDEIIIKGTDQMVLVRWLKKYKEYKVRIGKRLGPDSEYWLIRYDDELIDPDEMLKMIQDDPEIEEAEFNKELKKRNR